MTNRRKLVAGNWKMHGSQELVTTMIAALSNHIPPSIEVALFPPYLYLAEVAAQTKGTNIAFGAQNCATHLQGAYTGEISAAMLAELGCQYVIIGHSERRSLYGETNEVVTEKIAAALVCGLTPVLCIGETAVQRENGETLSVLKKQLSAIMERSDGAMILSKIVIAYEPVWAIGTGKTATPELAQETHSQIRQFLAQYSPTIAEQVLLLYGGSVKADNAAALSSMSDIDGFLVGGASLDPTQFLLICQEAVKGR